MIYALSTKELDPKDVSIWDNGILELTKFELWEAIIK
jgi:hypothetical protein